MFGIYGNQVNFYFLDQVGITCCILEDPAMPKAQGERRS